MDYEEFIRLRRANAMYLGVDRAVAIQAVGMLPKGASLLNTCFLLLAILSFPGAFIVTVFWKWWVGFLLLIFVAPWLLQVYKAFCVQQVLAHAERDRDFYEMLLESRALAFEDRRGNQFGGMYQLVQEDQDRSVDE